MTTTNHALTGAAIAVIVKKPWLALPLAFLSHFFCDAIPHFGIGMEFGSLAMYTWLLVDGLIALGFAIFLIKMKVKSPVLLAISGFVAMSPDLAWLYYGIQQKLGHFVVLDPISHFHKMIQWYQHVPGIFVELIWASLMLFIILRFGRESYQNSSSSKA